MEFLRGSPLSQPGGPRALDSAQDLMAHSAGYCVTLDTFLNVSQLALNL